MKKILFLSALLLTTASLAVSAQAPDKISAPTSSPLACPSTSGPPSQTPHKWVAVSTGVMAKNKIQGKDPKYPSDAKKAHVEGRVVLAATISESGDVEDLCVIQGPTALQQPAVDAVKMWKYKPFALNGQPVEVKTQVNLDFTIR